MKFRRTSQDDVGFQMAPMIDIIFVMLLFFIITSALEQNEKELTVALPQTVEGQTGSRKSSEIVINVTEKGEIVVHNEKLTLKVLGEKLKQLAELYLDSVPAVIVRGDKHTNYGKVVEVLDVCAQAGMYKVSFISVEKEP